MTTPVKRTGPRGLHRDAVPARILAHLAENGPTSRDDIVATVGDRSGTRMAYARLQELGYIKAKVWLTPDGLAELRRMGMAPKLDGVAAIGPSCGCEAQPCGCPS